MNIRHQQIANLSLLSAEIPDSFLFRFLSLSLPFLSLALFAILLSSHFLPPIPFIFPYSSHPTSLLFPRPFSYLRLLTFLISFHPSPFLLFESPQSPFPFLEGVWWARAVDLSVIHVATGCSDYIVTCLWESCYRRMATITDDYTMMRCGTPAGTCSDDIVETSSETSPQLLCRCRNDLNSSSNTPSSSVPVNGLQSGTFARVQLSNTSVYRPIGQYPPIGRYRPSKHRHP